MRIEVALNLRSGSEFADPPVDRRWIPVQRLDEVGVFLNDGEEKTFAQIAMATTKDDAVDVEETDDGYLVNGERFTPVVNDGVA